MNKLADKMIAKNWLEQTSVVNFALLELCRLNFVVKVVGVLSGHSAPLVIVLIIGSQYSLSSFECNFSFQNLEKPFKKIDV